MSFTDRFLFFLFFFSSGMAFGQQSIVLTQFSQDRTSFNPAYASASEAAYVSVFHRSQWLGYDDKTGAFGAPSTQYISFQAPVDVAFGSAMGLSLVKDNLGPLSTIDIRFVMSVMKRVGNVDWSIGLQPSYKTRSIRSDVLNPVNAQDPSLEDLLTLAGANTSAFDLNLGTAISAQDYTVGVAMLNALESDLNFLSTEGKLVREISLYGTYIFDLAYKLELEPFLLLRSNLSSQTFDIGTLALYDGIYGVGVSYRNEESFSFMSSVRNIKDSGVSVGFAFDFVVSNKADKNFNSMEFFAIYNLPELSFGNRKIIRTPRFRY